MRAEGRAIAELLFNGDYGKAELRSFVLERLKSHFALTWSDAMALLHEGVGPLDEIEATFGSIPGKKGPVGADQIVGDLAGYTADVHGFFDGDAGRFFLSPGAGTFSTVRDVDQLNTAIFWRPYGRTASEGQVLHTTLLPGGRALEPIVHYSRRLEPTDLLQVVYLTTDPYCGTALQQALVASGQPCPTISVLPNTCAPSDVVESWVAANVGAVFFVPGIASRDESAQVLDVERQCVARGVTFVRLGKLHSEGISIPRWSAYLRGAV